MRADLEALRAAGIRRTRFSARFSNISRRGLIRVYDVLSPTGSFDHAWIKSNEWKDIRPKKRGEPVEFLASIEPYFRDDGSQELGLFHCKEVL